MGANQNQKKPVVWQDVRPTKTIPQKPIKKSKRLKTKEYIAKRLTFIPKAVLIKHTYALLAKASKRNKIITVSSLFVIVAILAGFYVKNNFLDPKVDPNKISIQDLAAKKPEYKTILPSGKTIEELGGWKRISPTDRSAVFTYIDAIDNVQVNVSEQPLPDEFKEETATQIEQLAKGFKADEKVTVGSTEIYIGTSVDGPQSVIFTKNDLLILIKSASKIESNSWATYVNSLQ